MIHLKKILITFGLILAALSINAEPVKSKKHAKKATETRQAVFKLLGSNMSPLGAMAKGKIPLDAETAKKHGLRINQLSLMIGDYLKVDTRGHDVETEALDDIWKKPDAFSQRINDLQLASAKLIKASETNDAAVIKKAIGGVGRTCGGCHDDFKVE